MTDVDSNRKHQHEASRLHGLVCVRKITDQAFCFQILVRGPRWTFVASGMAAKNRKGRTSSSSSFRGEAHEPGLDITDLHLQWDGHPEIRARLREGGPFLHPDSGLCCDNRVCVLNAPIIIDMLCHLSSTFEKKLPSVGALRKEMKALYKINKRVGPEIDTIVKQDSFHVRKLLSHVKAKCRRAEYGAELCMQW